MRTENLDIRIMLNEKNITQKAIANFIGVHEATVTRWLRTKNLNSDIRNKIISAANSIESGGDMTQKIAEQIDNAPTVDTASKKYKLYLSVKKEADIIEILNKERNKSGLIKKALIAYLRGGTE